MDRYRIFQDDKTKLFGYCILRNGREVFRRTGYTRKNDARYDAINGTTPPYSTLDYLLDKQDSQSDDNFSF